MNKIKQNEIEQNLQKYLNEMNIITQQNGLKTLQVVRLITKI